VNTLGQDRRLDVVKAHPDVVRVDVMPTGPNGVAAVMAIARRHDGGLVCVERIYADGTVDHQPRPWLGQARVMGLLSDAECIALERDASAICS
jgi:hypothetical protein